MKFCSFIMTHYGSTPERSETLRRSLESLFTSTTYPMEVLVADNGGIIDDSEYLLGLTKHGIIHTYLRNSTNMSFGFARNQLINMSHGQCLIIADNDLLYQKGWLEDCLEVLEAFPDRKLYATCLMYPAQHRKFTKGKLEFKGQTLDLSARAGSNCFVIRREDFFKVGPFSPHRIAGTWWAHRATRLGYLAAVVPGQKVQDMGIHKGYNMKISLPIKLAFHNGQEVYFNRDELRKLSPNLNYYD